MTKYKIGKIEYDDKQSVFKLATCCGVSWGHVTLWNVQEKAYTQQHNSSAVILSFDKWPQVVNPQFLFCYSLCLLNNTVYKRMTKRSYLRESKFLFKHSTGISMRSKLFSYLTNVIIRFTALYDIDTTYRINNCRK